MARQFNCQHTTLTVNLLQGNTRHNEMGVTKHHPEGLPFAPSFSLRFPPASGQILKERSFNFKLSGNEVYCTNASLLLIKIMLCSKLHCQKVLG